jgi:DNA repair photolyase
VDLRDHLLALLAPLEPGDELAPGLRFAGASTEVGLRLAFELRGEDVLIDVAPLGEGKFAARSGRFGFSYRSEGGRKALDPRAGLALCRTVASLAARNEERVVAGLEQKAREAPAEASGPRVREVRVTRLLEPARRGTARIYTLSPYVGCLIGCRYCYAQTPVGVGRRVERLPEVPWGSYVDVRVNAAEVLAAELAASAPRPLKFCPIVSDPYQAVEARYGITRACLEAIRDAGAVWPALVLTRSKLIGRDVALLASLPAAWAGASIPTLDDEARRHFEPRAASIPERLDALRSLRAAGVRTVALVQPLLPGPIDALADALAAVVTSVSIDVLRGEEGAGADFDDPRYGDARADGWQRARASELARALEARGVPIWKDELPPELDP